MQPFKFRIEETVSRFYEKTFYAATAEDAEELAEADYNESGQDQLKGKPEVRCAEICLLE